MKNNPHSKTLAYICLAATCIIWGVTWVGSRYGAKIIPGLQLSYIRQFISGSLVLVFFFIKGEKLPTWQQFKWLLLTGCFMFFFNNGFGTWAVHYIPGGLAALISALYPICMVLIDWLVFKQKNVNKVTVTGLVTGIVGVAFVLYQNAFGPHPDGYLTGVLLCFIGMIAWSFGSLIIARNKVNINPYYAAGWQMFLGSLMIFVFATATSNHIPIKNIPLAVWEDILALAIIGSAITYIAFIYTLKTLPGALASIYAYINPIVAMLAGALILHEALTLNLAIGAAITLMGVYLVNYSLKSQKEPGKETGD